MITIRKIAGLEGMIYRVGQDGQFKPLTKQQVLEAVIKFLES